MDAQLVQIKYDCSSVLQVEGDSFKTGKYSQQVATMPFFAQTLLYYLY